MPNSIAALPLAYLLSILIAGSGAAAELVIEPLTVPVMKSVFGTVQSVDIFPARARLGGTIVSIAVEEGDSVDAGMVVATIVDTKLTLRLDALDARVKAVSAQLENANANLARGENLFARGTISKSQVDRLRTDADVLDNQLDAVRAERAVIVQQAQEGAVTAPSSGRVLSVPVTQGSVILPGETIATIAGGGYFLRLSLPERHAGGIAEGDDVIVGQRGVGQRELVPGQLADASLKGTIAKVYPEIKDGRVLADVDVEGLGDFFVGERTLVSIPIGSRDIIAVPPTAIMTRHGLDYVKILRSQGPVEIAVIPGETFSVNGGQRTEILSGLRTGDRVALP